LRRRQVNRSVALGRREGNTVGQGDGRTRRDVGNRHAEGFRAVRIGQRRSDVEGDWAAVFRTGNGAINGQGRDIRHAVNADGDRAGRRLGRTVTVDCDDGNADGHVRIAVGGRSDLQAFQIGLAENHRAVLVDRDRTAGVGQFRTLRNAGQGDFRRFAFIRLVDRNRQGDGSVFGAADIAQYKGRAVGKIGRIDN